MSINPVPPVGSVGDAQSAEQRTVSLKELASTQLGSETAHPDPGTPPKQEAHIPLNVSDFEELPQDEVEVQRDSETTEVVIKYLNRSGSVILQVPSSEVLGVAHAIDQDFQKAAEVRERSSATQADGGGGKVHGH
jgi:uncharacterized FlaG/YvyC family protein